MVALYPDPEQAVRLALPDGEPAEILHVTLAFLGDTDPDLANRAAAVVSRVATEMGPLAGLVGGVASFGTEPDAQEPLYPSILLPDVPGLAELRQAVCDALDAAGIEYACNHGFTPHLTLAYAAEPTMPPAELLGSPLTFDRLTLARGDVPRDFVLGSPLVAAGDKRPANWTPPHADEVVDVRALASGLRGKTDPVRLAVAKEVMGGALDKVGIDFDATNPLVEGLLSQSASQVTQIAETTRLNVMRSIREAYEQGLTIPDTAALIREGMAAAAGSRAELIARTELVGVANGGAVAAAQIVGEAAGVEYWKRWLTADGADFPRHEDYEGLDGQTVPIDGVFDVGGYMLEFPGDPSGPPEEICQCRCTVAMVEAAANAEPDPDAEGDIEASAFVAPPVAVPSGMPIETGGDVPELAEKSLSRLEAVRNALTAAGVPEPKRAPIAGTFELNMGPVSLLSFLRSAEAAGATEIVSDRWPCDVTSLGEGAAFQENGADYSMGVFQLSADVVGFVDLSHGTARIHVAAKSRDKIGGAMAAFRARFPFAAPPQDDLVPITFWTYGQFGPQSYTRRVAVAPWDAITGNYTAPVRDELAALMGDDFKPGEGGQLLLWHGPPGTGKTWALRALASEWREWADMQYIADPDQFFGEHADYMMEVLLRESFGGFVSEEGVEPEQKWQVLVLEDTGEMLSADAKDRSGQGLSRLLNVVDGLIGQGLQILVLVTTNEQLDVLHPAVSRQGRCAAQTLFAPLSAEEASAWLGETVEEGGTLAELYARGRADQAVDPSGELAVEEEEGAVVAAVRGLRDIPSGLTKEDIARAAGIDLSEAITAATTVTEPPADIVAPEAPQGAQLRWEGTLLVEGQLTEDGRYIEPGATTWRELPLTLMAQLETQEGHMGAQVAGRIDEIWRGAPGPDGVVPIFGRGVFDDGEFGQEIARMVGDHVLTGNSVDLAVRQFELAYKDDFDENGHRNPAVDEAGEGEEPDLLEAMFGADLVLIFTDVVVGASTVCSFPAFAAAEIALAASGGLVFHAVRQSGMTVTRVGDEPTTALEVDGEVAEIVAVEEIESAVTASAAGLAPETPPGEWFADPEFEELTALTVTDDGRVFGHLAEWGTCHIGIPGVCTTAPRSMTNYAYFHLGEVEVESGDRIACGQITLGTGHASKHLGRVAASEHYDHTGAAVADVIVGEDDFGPWVAGALRADVDADRVRELTGAKLSGDWRNVNGNLELVGVLAVNVPGFPVPRVRAEIVAGAGAAHVTALTAAGILGDAPALSPEDQAMLAALGARAGGLDALVELAAGIE